MRYELYGQIKLMVSGRSEYYITRNEMKWIMNKLDLWRIRSDVFAIYNIPLSRPDIDPPHEVLMRAHYTYMIDTKFDQRIRMMKDNHEKYITTLLENVHNCKDMASEHPLSTQEIISFNWNL